MQSPLPFHPLANKFPLLNGADFTELVADIEAHGLREPITLFEGQVLDGRNRYRACLRLKLEPRFKKFKGDAAAACAFVISQNIVRRHLKAKDKREAIAALLKADPNKSDRQIAEMTKASPIPHRIWECAAGRGAPARGFRARASDMLPDCVPPLGLSANILTKRCYFRRTARNQQMQQHRLMASRTGCATVRDPCISGTSASPTLRDHASRNIAPASGALPDFTEVRRR